MKQERFAKGRAEIRVLNANEDHRMALPSFQKRE
jgi:hypothetical protein